MKKILFIVSMIVGLMVCVLLFVLEEDSWLKEVYSVCINIVQGLFEKIEVC